MSVSMEGVDQKTFDENTETTGSSIERARETAQEWIISELAPTIDRYHENLRQKPIFEMNSREYSVTSVERSEGVERTIACVAKYERDAVKDILDQLRMN